MSDHSPFPLASHASPTFASPSGSPSFNDPDPLDAQTGGDANDGSYSNGASLDPFDGVALPTSAPSLGHSATGGSHIKNRKKKHTKVTGNAAQQAVAPATAADPAAGGAGEDGQGAKGQKRAPTGGNGLSGGHGQRKKKQKEEDVNFDESNIHAPLPVNLKLYCKHGITGRYHHCKILDTRKKQLNDPKSLACKSLDQIGGFAHLPRELIDIAHSFHDHPLIYYVHYTEWDRRMDEWVSRDRLLLMSQIGLIQQIYMKKYDEKMNATGAENKDGSVKMMEDESKEGSSASSSTKDYIPVVGDLIVKPAPEALDPHLSGHGNFSAEDIHAHEEATKVKNIDAIQIGKYKMETWYFSPLPPEYNQFSTLHFCEFCFSFFGYEIELKRHSIKCKLRHPPGNEIYRSQEQNITVAVFEVDGAKERVYCENLCYIAKLFLDHKTLEFDCTPFLFYILCEVDERGYHMVGYFSKEKISQTNYNLACILCLPCHQRKGYGKVLISLSYELSKIEEKPGSPEKPISDLGKVSYMSYWTSTLLSWLWDHRYSLLNGAISIEELSRATCIVPEDILECLKAVHVLVWYKQHWVFSLSAIEKWIKERDEKKAILEAKRDPNAIFVSQIRPEKLSWTPFFANKKAAKIV